MSFNREEFRYESLLGSLIAQKDPYFEQTACMSEEWREIIGFLEVLKIVDQDPDLRKEIEKLFIPICQKLGIATWKRDIVTDLAMKLKSVRQVSDAK